MSALDLYLAMWLLPSLCLTVWFSLDLIKLDDENDMRLIYGERMIFALKIAATIIPVVNLMIVTGITARCIIYVIMKK